MRLGLQTSSQGVSSRCQGGSWIPAENRLVILWLDRHIFWRISIMKSYSEEYTQNDSVYIYIEFFCRLKIGTFIVILREQWRGNALFLLCTVYCVVEYSISLKEIIYVKCFLYPCNTTFVLYSCVTGLGLFTDYVAKSYIFIVVPF